MRVFASPNNPGAREVAAVLQQAMAGLELSAAPPPTANHFLLYLAHDTFVGEAGRQLAEEVRLMMRTGQPIVLLHENDMEDGGCEFGRFFSTTPQDIIGAGLYKATNPGLLLTLTLTLTLTPTLTLTLTLTPTLTLTLTLILILTLTLTRPSPWPTTRAPSAKCHSRSALRSSERWPR